jgi:outer membrane protein OmpA-like peptidoglycan-associated protein
MKDLQMTIITSGFHAKTLMLGVALLALSACASTEPNTRIADAQGRLTAAYNDKETAERGQGDLANAKTSLLSAETNWKRGKEDTAEHDLLMGQTYIELAETRGKQAKLEQANVTLSTQARLAEKNRQLASKDMVIAGKNDQLADKDKQLALAQDQLRESNMKVTELGSTMVLQDVSFETGKSQLLPGGVNRLQPLINYLKLSPQTKVRIEGYTDNVGGAAYNSQLSLDRANSVKTIISAGGIDGARIETVGSGLTKPVATNATAAGRQSNRRVEVTLLKQPAAL